MSGSRESHFPPISARFRAALFKVSSLETTRMQDRAGKQRAICLSFPQQRQQQQQHEMETLRGGDFFRSLISLEVAKCHC